MLEFLQQPWPWYITGPLIGLMVPILLLVDGKQFGLSSNLRHICSMCVPSSIEFFNYDWKKEIWNLCILLGILIGGFLAHTYLNPSADVSQATVTDLNKLGIEVSGLGPQEIFNWSSLFTFRGFMFIAVGGFLVGFGSRYGDGCTSGHAIMGLSMMNWPSLIAIIGFFIGGLLITHVVFPFLTAL
jgi:uncharacterized membrane protein YedE/YeeE